MASLTVTCSRGPSEGTSMLLTWQSQGIHLRGKKKKKNKNKKGNKKGRKRMENDKKDDKEEKVLYDRTSLSLELNLVKEKRN